MSERAPHLPHWPSGTVAMLSTGANRPLTIPISTAVRAGDARVLLALGRRRDSLARLRANPRVALTVLCEGNIAVTAHCRARVVQEPMQVSDRVAAIELTVCEIQQHGQPTFEIDSGVRWHWVDPEARRTDEKIRNALIALGGGGAAPG